jgi:hypothetical protein
LLKCSILFLRAKSNSIDESYLDEIEEEDEVTTQPKSKKKSGRKGKWSTDNLNDFIDIIVNNDEYMEKLIFRNTKYQHNGTIYERIRQELKKRSSERGETMEFTVNQLRNKFKKCVGDCKKVALTIKTATGIKKIQREKGYGAWFDQLFALIKTRDSCRPEMATEPSANKDEEQAGKDDDDDDDESVEVTPKKVYVPIRSKRRDKRKEQEKTLSEVVDVVKNMVDKDPMKDLVTMVREEMKQSREHELKLYQLMFNSSAHNFQTPRQTPETPNFFQQNSYYQNHGYLVSFLNSMNQPTCAETLNAQQTMFSENYPHSSSVYSSNSSVVSQYQKEYESL